MSQRMIDVGPGCFCQPVRWLECLMFSLLVALLCIFLCQRRWAIWTARALQRPAGHPSSSWRSECSASAECWWFVMTWEPADRQVSYKKTCTHFPFVVQWKHRCSGNMVGWVGAQLSREAGTWQLCHFANLQTWLEVFCLLFCLSGFWSWFHLLLQVTICCGALRGIKAEKGSLLKHIFIFILSLAFGILHEIALSREHHGKTADGCKASHAIKSETWDAKDKTESKFQFFSQTRYKIDCFLQI